MPSDSTSLITGARKLDRGEIRGSRADVIGDKIGSISPRIGARVSSRVGSLMSGRFSCLFHKPVGWGGMVIVVVD